VTPRILIARTSGAWRRPAIAVVGLGGQLVLGLLVAAVRVVRVVVDLVAAFLIRSETRLAAAIGRPAISQTAIGHIARAFITEFCTAYTTTTTR